MNQYTFTVTIQPQPHRDTQQDKDTVRDWIATMLSIAPMVETFDVEEVKE
jgi:hypothetical protein